MAAAPPPPLASVSEAALRGCELREGADLDPGPRLPCTVSFVRGQERSVALSVAGMPPVRLLAMLRGGAPRGAGCRRSLSVCLALHDLVHVRAGALRGALRSGHATGEAPCIVWAEQHPVARFLIKASLCRGWMRLSFWVCLGLRLPRTSSGSCWQEHNNAILFSTFNGILRDCCPKSRSLQQRACDRRAFESSFGAYSIRQWRHVSSGRGGRGGCADGRARGGAGGGSSRRRHRPGRRECAVGGAAAGRGGGGGRRTPALAARARAAARARPHQDRARAPLPC